MDGDCREEGRSWGERGRQIRKRVVESLAGGQRGERWWVERDDVASTTVCPLADNSDLAMPWINGFARVVREELVGAPGVALQMVYQGIQ
jgi:hypothetical protein